MGVPSYYAVHDVEEFCGITHDGPKLNRNYKNKEGKIIEPFEPKKNILKIPRLLKMKKQLKQFGELLETKYKGYDVNGHRGVAQGRYEGFAVTPGRETVSGVNENLKDLALPFSEFCKKNGVELVQDIWILYGSVKADDIVLKEELEKISAQCPDVKVVHVLSDQPDWPGEKGFITREIIEKYSVPGCTYMFCGPLAMFQFVSKALKEMQVHPRRFRHDVVNNPSDVSTLPGYPKGTETKTFKITVVRGIHQDVISANAAEPVAVALERAAIPVDTHCRNGECGFCRSQLLEGEIFVSPIGDGRRMMDKEMGWFHACSSWPLSDLKIKIPIM